MLFFLLNFKKNISFCFDKQDATAHSVPMTLGKSGVWGFKTKRKEGNSIFFIHLKISSLYF